MIIDTAIVQEIVKESKLNYITVKVERTGLSIENVQVMTPIAGLISKNKAGFGMVYIPPVGQRVLIGYLDQGIGSAVCLGCLYDEVIYSPMLEDKSKPKFYFSYGSEWEFTISKTEKKLSFVMGNEDTKLEIDGEKGNIDISVKNQIKIAVGENSITIGKDSISIKSSKTLNIEGQNVTSTASSASKIEGATISVKSQGKADFQGSTVNVKGTSSTQVSGATVKVSGSATTSIG